MPGPELRSGVTDADGIGRTVLPLTELGFGAASIGNLFKAIDDATAIEAVDTAWDCGFRYFDTAPHYGLGLAERRLGVALRDRDRSDYVLSTKVGRLLQENPAPTGSDLAAGGFDVPDTLVRRFDFSSEGVRRSLDESLARLGVDHVDIVYVHDPDEHVDEAIDTALPALIDLREQGVIGAVGVGMNQFQAPLRMVKETGIDVVMLAGRWTLLDRTGRPLLDECAARGVAVVAASPYNSGLLARSRPPKDAVFDYGTASPEVVARAHRLADICDRHGVSVAAAAVQFPLRHPAVRSVVTGIRTGAQAASAMQRLRTPVPPECWAELDA